MLAKVCTFLQFDLRFDLSQVKNVSSHFGCCQVYCSTALYIHLNVDPTAEIAITAAS